MHDEENNEEAEACPQCGCRCGGMKRAMGMMIHMPREMKIAKLEKKEAILRAELEFLGKVKEVMQKMPEENK